MQVDHIYISIHGRFSPSYARRTSKIDRILISRELLPAVETTGTLEHHGLGIVSDHMGLFVTFNEKELFRGSVADLLKVENRDIVSTTPKVKESTWLYTY